MKTTKIDYKYYGALHLFSTNQPYLLGSYPLQKCILTLNSRMIPPPSKDHLHGKTLEVILTELSENIGWEKMGARIPIKCFLIDPSVKSSLVFLRKTPWARAKVEVMYTRFAAKRVKSEK
jgi:uncharacterized protein (DUF2132 family)